MSSPLERAIAAAGGQSALARAIGVQQAHVWYWLKKRDGKVPAEQVLPIEAVTGVSRHALRPDLYPEPATPAGEAAA